MCRPTPMKEPRFLNGIIGFVNFRWKIIIIGHYLGKTNKQTKKKKIYLPGKSCPIPNDNIYILKAIRVIKVAC